MKSEEDKVFVQSYSDEDYARMFIDDLTVDLSIRTHWLPEMEYLDRLEIIDKMMHRLGFYRREKWSKTEWGWQAKIRRR